MYFLEWIVEQRVVLQRAVGDQTTETIEDGFHRLYEHLNKGTAPVHLIIDNRYVGSFPTDVKALKQVVLSRHDNIGIVVAIGGNIMFKFASSVIAKLTGGEPLEYANTLEDALSFLSRVDPTLPQQIEYTDRPPTDMTA